MSEQYIPGLPGVRAARSAAHRIVFKQGWMIGFLAGGKCISGGASRDPLNTGDVDVLRAGVLLGKISSVVNSLGTVNFYAPSVLGVTTNAEAVGSTAIEAAAAVVTELVRRCGASGTFKLTGPPTASGTVNTETVTYSAASGTAITCTAITQAKVAGSLIQPTDGSEAPISLVPDGWGVVVTDVDRSTNVDVEYPMLPIGGTLISANLVNWPADASTKAWIVGQLNVQGGGKFVFDHLY